MYIPFYFLCHTPTRQTPQQSPALKGDVLNHKILLVLMDAQSLLPSMGRGKNLTGTL